jgi:hypothetical protein
VARIITTHADENDIIKNHHKNNKLRKEVNDPVSDNTTTNNNRTAVSANHVIRHQLNADFIAFCHAALGSPTLSTFLKAIRRGYLSTWPELTAKRVIADPPQSLATAKGHLDLIRQDVGSQKKTIPTPLIQAAAVNSSNIQHHPHDNNNDDNENDDDDDDNILSDSTAYTSIIPLDPILHVDLSDRFPVQSIKGNNYVLVAVYNNFIKVIPMRNREAASYVESHLQLRDFFLEHGHAPSIVRIDNESSQSVEQFLKNNNITIQFVPPHNHRANKAERKKCCPSIVSICKVHCCLTIVEL